MFVNFGDEGEFSFCELQAYTESKSKSDKNENLYHLNISLSLMVVCLPERLLLLPNGVCPPEQQCKELDLVSPEGVKRNLQDVHGLSLGPSWYGSLGMLKCNIQNISPHHPSFSPSKRRV
ncbi:hypothetical protein XENOCAPTIV_005101 [Xenoophorus captivus]|uniref:Uncharacterized protein n=1 Tax=Xenoophorus captivus TaxID=1517983 RepID=A0ABV0QQ24_9TELE